MPYQYLILEEAQLEYEQSLSWYLDRSEQAAENFVLAVEEAIMLICNHPKRWRNHYKEFRELNLKKYPFSLVYIIEESIQTVVITSIFHHKRHPQNKYLKIK